LLDRREARTLDRGHGRQDEVRHLVASTDLTDYLDWPGLVQVCRLERTWREHGAVKRALHYMFLTRQQRCHAHDVLPLAHASQSFLESGDGCATAKFPSRAQRPC